MRLPAPPRLRDRDWCIFWRRPAIPWWCRLRGCAQLTDGLQGGSGAGGGGNDGDNEEGAGGGGSGGTVYLVAATLHIDGALSATGGLGGRDDYHYNGGANRECCNNGGPGSVGRIRLDYDTVSGSSTTTPAAGYIQG